MGDDRWCRGRAEKDGRRRRREDKDKDGQTRGCGFEASRLRGESPVSCHPSLETGRQVPSRVEGISRLLPLALTHSPHTHTDTRTLGTLTHTLFLLSHPRTRIRTRARAPRPASAAQRLHSPDKIVEGQGQVSVHGDPAAWKMTAQRTKSGQSHSLPFKCCALSERRRIAGSGPTVGGGENSQPKAASSSGRSCPLRGLAGGDT